jgi:hypothetical protein
VTDGRGIDGWRGNWEVVWRHRFRRDAVCVWERGRRWAGRPPAGVDVAPPKSVSGAAAGSQSSSQMGGRTGKQAVWPDCVSQSRTSRHLRTATKAERVRTGVLPSIQGRGSKGHGCPAEKTNVREAGSRVRPERGPSQKPTTAGPRTAAPMPAGTTSSPVASTCPVVPTPRRCMLYTCSIMAVPGDTRSSRRRKKPGCPSHADQSGMGASGCSTRACQAGGRARRRASTTAWGGGSGAACGTSRGRCPGAGSRKSLRRSETRRTPPWAYWRQDGPPRGAPL